MALVRTLTDTPQDFTDSWVDYGSEIGVDGHAHILLWLDIDINDTENARFRLLAKHTEGGADEYTMPIQTVADSVVYIQDEYFEFAVDADGKKIVSFELYEVIPFVQVQIQAGDSGVIEGQVLSSKYTLR